MSEFRTFVMKSVLVLACVLVASVLITGCKPPDSKAMDSWLGQPKSELIMAWGPPSRTTSDGQGGEILIYEQYVELHKSKGVAQYDANGGVVWTNPESQGYTRSRMFFADKDGKIYSWKSQGL